MYVLFIYICVCLYAPSDESLLIIYKLRNTILRHKLLFSNTEVDIILVLYNNISNIKLIYNFNLKKTYLGVPGEGTFINGKKIKPAWAQKMVDACIMTGFPAAADKSTPAMEIFIKEVSRYKKIRMIGSAALALAYVGEGVADTYYESGTNLWDVAAGLAIIKASGGHYRMIPTGKKPLNFDLWASAHAAWTV